MMSRFTLNLHNREARLRGNTDTTFMRTTYIADRLQHVTGGVAANEQDIRAM